MKIISADARLAEKRGAKIVLLGESGIGKTTLLKTLLSTATLFIDAEAGDLSVLDWPVDTVRIDDWHAAVDLACRIGGPNLSFPSTAFYSEAHYRDIGGALENLDRYDTIFVDSLTELARLSYRHAERQPEATSERTGKKDVRATYGLHGRQMTQWLQQLQHARGKNVIFVAVLEKVLDDFNRLVEWRPQLEGGKTGRELPAIIDEIVTLAMVDFGNGKPIRALVCDPQNQWRYPAKDRSGRLAEFEPPDLGKLIAKLIPATAAPAKAA
jgi:hypothetical protein